MQIWIMLIYLSMKRIVHSWVIRKNYFVNVQIHVRSNWNISGSCFKLVIIRFCLHGDIVYFNYFIKCNPTNKFKCSQKALCNRIHFVMSVSFPHFWLHKSTLTNHTQKNDFPTQNTGSSKEHMDAAFIWTAHANLHQPEEITSGCTHAHWRQCFLPVVFNELGAQQYVSKRQ